MESAKLTRHAVDTSNHNVNLFHFARSLDQNTSNVLFWVVTVVRAPREIRDGRLVNGGGATDFCAPILDASDKPFTDFVGNLRK